MLIPKRGEIKPGLHMQVVEKQNQRNGKVMLTDSTVGRVQAIVGGSSQPQH